MICDIILADSFNKLLSTMEHMIVVSKQGHNYFICSTCLLFYSIIGNRIAAFGISGLSFNYKSTLQTFSVRVCYATINKLNLR
jgi:hypothetical protein